jgi:peroxiredoxin
MLAVGDVAPDFTLPDLASQPHTLSEALKQGPVLLVFWKAQCVTTRITFPYLERLRQAYPQTGWQLWGIGQDDVADVKPFLRRVGKISFPLLVDYPRYAASLAYDPLATPTIFLVEPSDTIGQTAIAFSKNDLNALSERLAARLDVVPVVVAPADDGNPPFKPG